jgi:hypothetical protein
MQEGEDGFLVANYFKNQFCQMLKRNGPFGNLSRLKSLLLTFFACGKVQHVLCKVYDGSVASVTEEAEKEIMEKCI